MFWECVEKSKKIAHAKATQIKNEPLGGGLDVSDGTGTTHLEGTGKTVSSCARSKSQNLKNERSNSKKQERKQG